MATVKLKLNICRETKSGKYPLVIQLIHKGQRRLLPVGIKIEPACFDMKRKRVIPHPDFPYTGSEIRKMNRQVRNAQDIIKCKIEELATSDYTANDIAIWYRCCRDGKCVFTYFEYMIEEKKKSTKFGTARAYQSTLNSLKKFCGLKKIRFTDINLQFIRDYEAFLQQEPVSDNTIAYYMRNFQTIYNRAESDGIFQQLKQESPFKEVKVTPAKTIKRALTIEQIRTIAMLDLHNKPLLELTRDMFMASFYLRGIPFVDLVHLLKKNVINNTVHYYRQKTGVLVSVEIIPPLQTLVNKYAVQSSPYLFPGLMQHDGSCEEEEYKEYRRALYYYNRRLKQIGELAGLDFPLTGYMARHTWATIAKNKGASTAIISEGLGHSSERITQIYLKSFEDSVINRVNSMVAEL